ncbi:hypothetical protein H4582DRAFT_1375317 [Lactarius indigo]|nr:hypothetical protein H4582DRAFT_1375317 [Lactarius indigo]
MTSLAVFLFLVLSKQMPSRSDLGWICGEGPPPPFGFERVNSWVCSPHPCGEGGSRAPSSYPSISCSPLLRGHGDRTLARIPDRDPRIAFGYELRTFKFGNMVSAACLLFHPHTHPPHQFAPLLIASLPFPSRRIVVLKASAPQTSPFQD